MQILGQVAVSNPRRAIRLWLAVVAMCALPVTAQAPSAIATGAGGQAAAPAGPVAQLSYHGVVELDGPWKFEIGDDPRWADPAFDDSGWRAVKLGQTLYDQGIESYSGYGWYRMRLEPEKLAEMSKLSGSAAPVLMVTGDSVGQVSLFINGVEANWTRGMTDRPTMYFSPPITAGLQGVNLSAPVELAIRTWAGPGVTVKAGLLDKVELGSERDIEARRAAAIGHQWNERANAAIAVTFLFVCVTVLGLALYLAQRHHKEYLWLAILCASVAAQGAADVLLGLALIPYGAYRVFTIFSGHIFMAVTMEFVLHFAERGKRPVVRGIQIGVLLVPFLWFLPWTQVYQALSVTAEVVFCATVCVMLYRAWRKGMADAGVMLIPFFLAATADSADTVLSYFASLHWIPERFLAPRFYLGPIGFGTGTVAFTVFLGSLMAVILYRFIRVSQVEQRSNAEIEAARSVQSLLIPTQLPSTKNFMLESAYLPVNGVGGDFFQVIPLEDESLLIVVGDVSGKGLQAAMNSSTLVGALRNELSHDPATVLSHLNRVLLGAVRSPGKVPELDAAPCFATCLCARIYPDGTLMVANAGHLGPYRDGRELELLPGLPLGVIADAQYEQTTHLLNRGDRLVFLSDGVVEAQNAEGELFGFERTQQVSNEPARYIAQTAQHFGQTDDITVISLYVASRSAEHKGDEMARSR
jgi:hypothetical protein